MKRRIFCFAFILLCLSGSATFAIAPIGQPAASLRDHWLSLGVDYSHTDIDLKAENIKNTQIFTEGTIKDLKFDLILGKADACITDYWEVFAGVGAAKVGDFSSKRYGQYGDSNLVETDIFELGGDLNFAAQIGTKVTLYEKALFKAGILCQLTWLSFNETLQEDIYNNFGFITSGKANVDTDLLILQVAPGVSYQLFYGLSIYGGPLLQLVRGKVDGKGKTGTLAGFSGSADIREDSAFGGWVGLHADIDILTTFNVEYQATGSSNTIGLSLTSKF
jgi:hypothetical protein